MSEEEVQALLSRLGLQLPGEDVPSLLAYLPALGQAVTALYSLPLGDAPPALTFAPPRAAS
jgi:hypothetical protein